MKLKLFITLSILAISFIGCNNKDKNETQKQEQNEITIGNQKWYFKDLDVTTFSNGEVIPEAKSESEYLKYKEQGKPAWCYVEFDSANGKLGKLYNRWVIRSILKNEKHIEPSGWKLPTEEDFKELNSFLGKNNENRDETIVAAEKINQAFKSQEGWLLQATSYRTQFNAGLSYWCSSRPLSDGTPYEGSVSYVLDDKEIRLWSEGDDCNARLIRLIKKEDKTLTASKKSDTTNSKKNVSINDSNNSQQSISNNSQINNETASSAESGMANKDKVFFYDKADKSTIRKAYIELNQEVKILGVEGDFFKVEFTNSAGKVTSGYMLQSDINN